jgi:hypothetical protein
MHTWPGAVGFDGLAPGAFAGFGFNSVTAAANCQLHTAHCHLPLTAYSILRAMGDGDGRAFSIAGFRTERAPAGILTTKCFAMATNLLDHVQALYSPPPKSPIAAILS